MTLIDAATLASLVVLDESAMIDVVTIRTVTQVPDGGGGYTETETTATTKGYFWTVSGDELDAVQVREVGHHRVAIPKATAVVGTSRITVGGKSYLIKYLFPLHGYSTSRVLGLEDA
jgi:hypothetical protein